MSEAELFHNELSEWTIRLRSAERLHGGSGEHLEQRIGLARTLIVATEGEVRLALEGRQTELARGSVYWCEPEASFGFEPLDGSGFELYLFHFDVWRVRETDGGGLSAERAARLPQEGRLYVADSDRLPALCEGVWRHSREREPLLAFRCQLDFQELLYELFARLRAKPDNASEGLEFARHYMESHYGEPLTIERLARLAGISPKYFVDLFKKRYGVSAMEQLAELRLRQARRLLARTRLKLSDVAHRVGYADEFYFSRKFKKELGVSPTEYRKTRQRRLAVCSPELIGMLLPLDIVPFAAPLHPKWTEYYYRELGEDIPVHLSANRRQRPWRADVDLLRQSPVDLILAPADAGAEERGELERLAPVAYVAADGDWRERLLELAGMLDETRQARQWLERYDRLAAEGRRRLATERGDGLGTAPVAVVRLSGERLSLHGNRGIRHVLFDALGLPSPPAYADEGESYDVPVTPEELGALQPGWLLLLIRQESETLEAWRRLQRDPRWQAIGAVRNGRVGLLTSDPWREYSAHAHLRMLEQAIALLLGGEGRREAGD